MKRRVNVLRIEFGVREQDWKRNPRPMTDDELGYWSNYQVDGKPIEDGLATDFGAVVRTATHPLRNNGSAILTCGCGEPWCAGIEECVRVHHQGRYVYWTFYTPIVAGFGAQNLRRWKSKARKVRLCFLRSQLMSACRGIVAQLHIQPSFSSEEKRFIGSDSLAALLERGHGKWLFEGEKK